MSPRRFDPDRWRAALTGRFEGATAAAGEAVPSAAVAILVRERDGDEEVLLIRRAVREGDPWSGHMAFPGGRVDPADRDLLETAIRETREEIGVDLRAEGELLGRLGDLPAMARGKRVGIAIALFVFAVRSVPPLVPNAEVDEVVWAPLGLLRSGAAATTHPFTFEGRDMDLPGFRVGPHVVWGMTHRMLTDLLATLD